MPYYRDPTIMLTPPLPPLTRKAKQIKSIELVNMNQRLTITKFGDPHCGDHAKPALENSKIVVSKYST